MNQKISAVVLAKNEENNIEDCLKSLSWCDEILVIDDNSYDKTAEIAKKAGAKVFTHALNEDFSESRNFGLAKAKNEWVLFIDTDERITTSLREDIKNQISRPKADRPLDENIKNFNLNGFYIKRKDFLWGKELKYGEVGSMRLLRLAKKEKGKWVGKVHEEWKIKGKIGELKNPLMHYPHQSIAEFLKEINFYTDVRSKELYVQDRQTSWFSIILYPFGKFIWNYFFKLGFFDGIEGIIFALMMSFHSFLVRGKLWQLWQKK